MSVVVSFPVVGLEAKEWELTEAKLKEYEEAYPDMDVILVAKRARQWLVDNPRKRKTPRGMPKFLGAWIERQQNSGRYPLRAHDEAVVRESLKANYPPSAFAPPGVCNRCQGRGSVKPGGTYDVSVPCSRCQGTGRF